MIRLLADGWWTYLDEETGEVLGRASDLPTVSDPDLVANLQSAYIPRVLPRFRAWRDVTRAQFETWQTNVCQAYCRDLLKTPVPGSFRGNI